VTAVLRQPGFWLWLPACLLGALLMGQELRPAMGAFPGGAAAGLLMLFPVLVFGFWFFRRLHPARSRPKPYALFATVWGATAACGVALIANTAFIGILDKTVGLKITDSWGAAIAAPVDEETLKLLGVAVLVLLAPRAIRGSLDGYGYGALVGVGFQVIEDFLYVFNTIVLTGATMDVGAAFGSFFARVVFGAWWSHWTFTAVSGAGLGYLTGRTDRRLPGRVLVALAGYLLAMAMHCWWNSPFLEGGLLINMVKGLPLLVGAVLLYRVLRHRYLGRFRQVAGAEVRNGVLLSGEDEFLTHRKWRRAERRWMSSGESYDLVTRLRRAQLDLIDSDLSGEAAPRLRTEIAGLRARLTDCLRRQTES
jgi:RsiW-degrading membrane proteinase PrsW (M82 family)